MVKCAKASISLFVLYIFWFYGAFGPQNIILYTLAIASTGFIVLDMLRNRRDIRLGLKSVVPLYFIFGIYAVITGIFVSMDVMHMLSSVITYFAFAVLCYDAVYIMQRERSAEWLLTVLYVAAILCSVQTVFFGTPFSNGGVYVTTMSEHNNPNSLGIVLLIGIYATISSQWHRKHFYLSLISNLIFTYVIILSGSRKCFFAALALNVLWIIIVFTQDLRGKITAKLLVRLAILCGGLLFAIQYLNDTFTTTSIFERLQDLTTGGETRWALYEHAFELFSQNPIFGVGFRQYELYWGVYSHSTYAEIVACTGLIGSLIWLFGLGKHVLRLVKATIRQKSSRASYIYKVACAMLLVELFLAAGQIWIYDFQHMILLTILFLIEPQLEQKRMR